MKSKLAGYQPLRELVQAAISENAGKLSLVRGEAEKTASVYEDIVEKETPNGLDFHDVDHMDKLASALEEAGEKIAAGFIGGESPQGGTLMDTGKPVGGTQPYKKDKSKAHDPAKDQGKTTTHPDGAGGAGTLLADNMPMGVKPAYPAKGVLKKASASLLEQLQSKTAGENPFVKKDGEKKDGEKGEEKKVEKLVKYEKKEHGHIPSEKEEEEEKKAEVEKAAASDEKGKNMGAGHGRVGAALGGLGGANAGLQIGALKGMKGGRLAAATAGGAALGSAAGYAGGRLRHWAAKKVAPAEKKASAVDFILGAIDKEAAAGGAATEKAMGGETLDSAAGQGPKGQSNPGRSTVMSISSVINAKKRELKAPRIAELKQVLTEPAFSAAHDSKVNENLRNASKGGVKIAVAKTLLHKIAEEGCKCDGKGECQYCKLKAKVEAKKSEK